MILLSIDPGYDKTGFAVFHSDHPTQISLVTSGMIKTAKSDVLINRLHHILIHLAELIKTHHIDTMVMEQLFFFKNAKTVIGVAQAQGGIIALAASHKLKFHFLTPLQIKQIVTGNGRAEKTAVEKMLRLQLPHMGDVHDDDESDAIACGYAYCFLAPQFEAKLMQ